MKLSVVVTIDKHSQGVNPHGVNNTLSALARQTFTDFEVLLVSDNDSTQPQKPEDALQQHIDSLNLRHISLSDLNDLSTWPLMTLLEQTAHDYIVFMHGDSIPRWDFLASHQRRAKAGTCLLYTSPSPRDRQKSRMPSSA